MNLSFSNWHGYNERTPKQYNPLVQHCQATPKLRTDILYIPFDKACRILGVSRKQMHALIAAKAFPAWHHVSKARNCWVFLQEDLEAYKRLIQNHVEITQNKEFS